MAINAGLYASGRTDWETPPDFFDYANQKYGPLDLDVCATHENAKLDTYMSPEIDALTQEWWAACWMNPPYGREITRWVGKAYREVRARNASKVVCLLPARTDTAWWHDYVVKHADSVEFIRGRLKFVGAKSSAPFPSAIVVFKPAEN